MKKLIVIVGVLIAVVLAFGAAGYAFAQTPTPPTTPGGRGMMGGRGGMMGGQGMMGRGGMMGANGQYGPMHEYMEKAVAEALGVTEEELEAELAAGKTMWQVAEAQGLSSEAVQTLMIEARTQALEQMVDDGVITQEQADWMASRMQNMPNMNGGCQGMGGGYGRGGGRWNSPAAQPSPSTSG